MSRNEQCTMGAIVLAEAKEKEKKRIEAENKRRWEKEMELKEKELKLKQNQNNSIDRRLDNIERDIRQIRDLLMRFENQYFYPLSSDKK